MSSVNNILICGLLVIIVSLSSPQKIEYCKITVKDNAKHPDCRRYYSCKTGGATILNECPANQYFEMTTGKCVKYNDLKSRLAYCHKFVNTDNIQTYDKITCPDGVDKRLPIPNECTRFVHCLKSSIPLIKTCSPGTLFNTVQETCTAYRSLGQNDKYKCKEYEFSPVVGKCDKPDAVDYNDCTKYKKCISGKRYPIQCEDGKVYSNTAQGCVDILSPSDIGSCILLQTRVHVKDICKLVSSNKIAYPGTCRVFHDCTHSSPRKTECRTGLFFNPSSQTCTILELIDQQRRKECMKEIEDNNDNTKCPYGFIGVTRKDYNCRTSRMCLETGKSRPVQCKKPKVTHPTKALCISVEKLKDSSDSDIRAYYLTCGGANQPTNVLTPKEKCDTFQFTYKITDPKNCTQYYSCKSGVLSSLYTCEPGKVFDDHVVVEQCVSPESHSNLLKCLYFQNSPDCPNSASGIKRVDCMTYTRCTLGRAEKITCAKDTYFTTKKNGECVAFKDLLNAEKVGVCRQYGPSTGPVTNAMCNNSGDAFKTLPHKTDCRQFYVCQSGVHWTMKCLDGFVYKENDEGIGSCEEQNNINVEECGSIMPDPGKFTKSCPTTGLARMLVLSDPTCTQYYQCINGVPQGVNTCFQVVGSRSYASPGIGVQSCVAELPDTQQIVCTK